MPTNITYYACFLKNYNNYFNRIIKGFATLAEYETAVGAENYFIYSKAINYNPADNVSTELIMNDCPFDPDYVLILDGELSIVSRWFITESVFTRNKQQKYTLRRDLIYDFREELRDSPLFVQKGWLSDADPFILNPEGMSFNEIKKSETLLKDKSECAWIVGYISKSTDGGTVNVETGGEDIMKATALSDIASAMGVSTADLASVLNIGSERTIPSYFTKEIEARYGVVNNLGLFPQRVRNIFDASFTYKASLLNDVFSWSHPLWKSNVASRFSDLDAAKVGASFQTNASSVIAQMPTITGRKYFTDAQLQTLLSYNGTTILYNGNYYTLQVNAQSDRTEVFGPFAYTSYTSLISVMNTAAGQLPSFNLQNGGELSIRPTSTEVFINLIDASQDDSLPTLSLDISSSRAKMLTGVYDMFAIPFGRIFVRGTSQAFWTNEDTALRIAAGIAKEFDAACYDIQLLPYCPRQEFLSNGEITIPNNAVEHTDYDILQAKNAAGTDTDMNDVGYVGAGTGHPYRFTASVQNGSWPNDNADVISLSYEVDPNVSVYNVSGPTYDNNTHSISVSFDTDVDITDGGTVIFKIKYMGNHKQNIILWCKDNSFSVMLDNNSYKLSLKDSMKIESQCNKYRLCSPNYQGSFDFNVAKAGGSIDYFIAECTYKPYSPYIKVAPQFSFLYGANYGDARGLICGGDFSLPRISSAWENYQLNNKNYQNTFNREIQNLSFEQDLAMRQQLITGGIGVITSGVAGAGVGAKLGGGWGAAAGAAVGAAGSGAGLALDADILAKQQKETKQLAIDKFNYQLGNIKALPYTLAKIGAFDINSKIWPFVEYYTCTDEEKEALEKKIQYESMTVMRIDLFGTYFEAFSEKHYLKGELIRNEEIAEDNHIIEAIYYELVKGVYC